MQEIKRFSDGEYIAKSDSYNTTTMMELADVQSASYPNLYNSATV